MIPTFRDGTRVAFVGDSITHGGLFICHVLSAYRRLFPDRKVPFYNCGISGATLKAGLRFFDTDTARVRPDVAVVMYGVNDSDRTALRPDVPDRGERLAAAFGKFGENYEALCDRLEAIGAQPILCTPAPYDEFTPGDGELLHGCAALIAEYADFVRAFAARRGYYCVDYHAALAEAIAHKTVFRPDHVHPNEEGHLEMARCFLAAQGITYDDDRPFSPTIESWWQDVALYRDIVASEHFFIPDGLSQTARIEFARNYDGAGEYGAYFATLAKIYAEHAADREIIFSRIEEKMQNMISGS